MVVDLFVLLTNSILYCILSSFTKFVFSQILSCFSTYCKCGVYNKLIYDVQHNIFISKPPDRLYYI
eukprot:UN10749